MTSTHQRVKKNWWQDFSVKSDQTTSTRSKNHGRVESSINQNLLSVLSFLPTLERRREEKSALQLPAMISCQVLTSSSPFHWSKLPSVLLGRYLSPRTSPDVNLLCSVSAPVTASLDRLLWDHVHTVRRCGAVVTGQRCCQCVMASHWGSFFFFFFHSGLRLIDAAGVILSLCFCHETNVINSIFAQMRNAESCHSPNALRTFTFSTFPCSLDADATPDWFTSVEIWATKKKTKKKLL